MRHHSRWLHGDGIGDVGIAETALSHGIGTGKPFGHVAHDDALHRFRAEDRIAQGQQVARQGFIELGRAGLHGLLIVKYRRKHIVADIDAPERLLGNRCTFGRHQGHGVSDEADLLIQHPEYWGVPEFPVVDGLPGNYGPDPFQLLGPCGIDFFNCGMGVRAAEDLTVQQAGKFQVINEPGGTADDISRVPAGHRLADVPVRLRHGRHLPLPATAMTALST